MTLLDAVRIARRFWMTIAACILLAVGLCCGLRRQPAAPVHGELAGLRVRSVELERRRLRALGGHQRRGA